LNTVGIDSSIHQGNTVPQRAKIAVSLSRDVLELLDRHAGTRSRSRTVEEELMSALRAREWERLSAQVTPSEAADLTEWAAAALRVTDDHLAQSERRRKRRRRA
jgi:hypothetical protein